MKTKILFLLFGLASLFGQAQQQTKSQTETQIDTLLPTNQAGFITAARVRLALKSVVNYAQPVGNYLTSISSSHVINALGYTPYNASNPNNYITSADIAGKLNSADTTGLLPKVTAAATYQPLLVSGTSLKTINGSSLLGGGNIVTGGGDAYLANTQNWTGSNTFSGGTIIGDGTTSTNIVQRTNNSRGFLKIGVPGVLGAAGGGVIISQQESFDSFMALGEDTGGTRPYLMVLDQPGGTATRMDATGVSLYGNYSGIEIGSSYGALNLWGDTGIEFTNSKARRVKWGWIDSDSGNWIIGSNTNSGEKWQVTGSAKITSHLTVGQYRLSALNTAPSSSTDVGTEGEIRFALSGGTYYTFLCVATNTWVRSPLSTW